MRFPSVDYLMSATIVKVPQGLDFHDFPMA
jgi:hypothetical protein